MLFAYDGSELAKHAIAEAGQLLSESALDAVVLTIWRPYDVGFVPPGGFNFDAKQPADVRRAAEETAAHGAALARAAGFQAASRAVEGAPTWKAIADTADEGDARLIVLGSPGRHGLAGRLAGSVAGAVSAHSARSVLVVHRAVRSRTDEEKELRPRALELIEPLSDLRPTPDES
ncbi:MAG TPA: universal stress protein [Solirubrobacteraceae bacterium]|nr:universal stress protein [Solirubrobacteraceae bacterium]